MKNALMNLMKASGIVHVLNENAKPAEKFLCQTTIFKASAQTGATEFSKEK
jgi:hypothetical protein